MSTQNKVIMEVNRTYKLEKFEAIKWDMFFERNRLLITLLSTLFIGVMVLLHQTGVLVMVPGN